ncbi:hypothetical protein, partial [Clostridium perfringens]
LATLVAGIGGYGEDAEPLLTQAMPFLKARAANLNELADGACFLFATRPLPMEPSASELLTQEARALLAQLHTALDAVQQWDQEA